MLFCYRYLGNYQKADIMWSAYCKKAASNMILSILVCILQV